MEDRYRKIFEKYSTILETIRVMYENGFLDRNAMASSLGKVLKNDNISSRISQQIFEVIHYNEIGNVLIKFERYFYNISKKEYYLFIFNQKRYYAEDYIIILCFFISILYKYYIENNTIKIQEIIGDDMYEIIIDTFIFEIPKKTYLRIIEGSLMIFTTEEFFNYLKSVEWNGPTILNSETKEFSFSTDEGSISKIPLDCNFDNSVFLKISSFSFDNFLSKDSEILFSLPG